MKLNRRLITVVLLVGILSIIVNVFFKLIPLHIGYTRGSYSVMAYNIHSTGPDFDIDAPQIAQLIINEDPDFVYLTEFYENRGDTLDELLRQHYPFYDTTHRWGQNEGDAFYSEWKIDSVNRFFLNGERIMAYRVQVSLLSDTFAMYCCHLASNNVNSQITTWESVIKGFRKREQEVCEILKHVRKDKYPCIILGDLNDVSGSPTLNAIENAGFEEAWWNGGLGYGITFHNDWLRLRIDHILYDTNFDLCGIRVLNADYSDHDALVGSFNLKR